jgi:leucyl-tRNA synthetase
VATEKTDRYDFRSIEAKWQQRWADADLFRTRAEAGRRKFYYLDMFPYPSGKLHMGHIRNYTIGDVVARYRVMRGDNVLHPMGWDAFGLPAENAAIKNKTHPRDWTLRCIADMKQQFHQMGIAFDWNHEISTCEPDYYKWTQWFFLKFFEKGLAEKKRSFVNWCPQCATVLANEQVKQGLCERCDTAVTKKEMEQWFFKTTAYAQPLLEDIETLEQWPERVKAMQRNWIGRSEGVQFALQIQNSELKIEVFTTRIDTVYGVTYLVLAPEHPFVEALTKGTDREAEVKAFVQECLAQSEIDRAAADVEKKGFFTGAYAVNPMTHEAVPIWVANYVLMEYGTGAIMAVPAHDQRDFEFAKRYDLPIRVVIQPAGVTLRAEEMTEAYVGDGVQVNSAQFDGLPNREAMRAIAEFMEKEGIGRRVVNYRLRDWCLSRQRYWGAPIPVVYCAACGIVPVPEKDLPVLLPTDVEFKVGVNPLTTSATFVNTTCPRCGGAARRETDTMDTFVDSSWYFLRFASPHTDAAAFDRCDVDFWLPVDQYVGGVEHATMHLIYARFFTKVLNDLGLVSFREPFPRLFTQGMVNMMFFRCRACGHDAMEARLAQTDNACSLLCARCGSADVVRTSEKMSKSIGNQVTADFVCDTYGADTGRLYALSVGPPDQQFDWPVEEVEEDGVLRLKPLMRDIEGIARFLGRVWRLIAPRAMRFVRDWRGQITEVALTGEQKRLRRRLHQTIQQVTHDIERFSFNTAIAAMMKLVNEWTPFAEKAFAAPIACAGDTLVFSEAAENLVLLLSPFAPHLADELWERLGFTGSTYGAPFPQADADVAREEEIVIPVQVNGKVRARLTVPADISDDRLRELALNHQAVQNHLNGKTVQEVRIVPKRLVNVVVK